MWERLSLLARSALVFGVLLFVRWVHALPDVIRVPWFALWGCLLPACAAAAAWKGKWKSPPRPALCLLGIWAAFRGVSFFLSVNAGDAAQRAAVDLCAVAAFGSAFFLDGAGPRLAWEFRIAGVLAALSVLLETDAWTSTTGWRPFSWVGPDVSLLGKKSLGGAYQAMVLPLLLVGVLSARGPLRAASVVGLTLGIAHIVLSEGRGAALGAVVGGAVVLALHLRRPAAPRLPAWGAAAALLGLALAAMTTRGTEDGGGPVNPQEARNVSVSSRLEIWNGCAKMIRDHPWVGVGLAGFDKAFPEYRSGEEFLLHMEGKNPDQFITVTDPLSVPLLEACETGILPAAALLALLALAVASACRRARADPDAAGWAGMIAAFLVSGVFYSLNEWATHWVAVWLAAGEALAGGRPAAVSKKYFLTLAVATGIALALLPPVLQRLVSQGRIMQGGEPFVRALEAAHRADPTNALPAIALGRLSWERRDPDAAELWNERADRLLPNHGPVLVRLGRARTALGKFTEAEQTLARAARLLPDWWMPPLALAELRRAQGRAGEAAEFRRRAIYLHPELANALLERGLELLRQGKEGAAGDLLRLAVLAGADVPKETRKRAPERLERVQRLLD